MKALMYLCLLMIAPLSCRADDLSVSTASIRLEAVLRSIYPQVQRWSLTAASAMQSKRRPRLIAESDQLHVYRDGNLFQIEVPHHDKRMQFRVAGYQLAPVAMRRLNRGQILQAADVTMAERDFLKESCSSLLVASDLVGLRTRRVIDASEKLCSIDVELSPAVSSNEAVSIHCSRGDVSVSVAGIALNDGQLGDTIQVRREHRYFAMSAVVVAEGEVNACG